MTCHWVGAPTDGWMIVVSIRVSMTAVSVVHDSRSLPNPELMRSLDLIVHTFLLIFAKQTASYRD